MRGSNQDCFDAKGHSTYAFARKMGRESIDFVEELGATFLQLSVCCPVLGNDFLVRLTSLKVQVEYVRDPTCQSHAENMCKTVTSWCNLYNGQSCAL